MSIKPLSHAHIMAIADAWHDMGGTSEVEIGALEPLLWRDGQYRIHDVVSALKERGFKVSMTTNGQLLDIFAENLGRAGLSLIRTSWHSTNPLMFKEVSGGYGDYERFMRGVTLALEYSEIHYDKAWDPEVLKGKLSEYDWLHLHHEDFTGQYGKFYASHRNSAWYIEQQLSYERTAKELGYKKVSDQKKAVARAIRDYVASGGFMFAMCAATDSYDIALAAENVDIAETMFDGDPADRDAQQKLDFSKSFAFQDFKLEMNPFRYEFSDIDNPPSDPVPLRDPNSDYFTLFDFSAKYDPVPTMLTQNHVNILKGFMGQTTAFKKSLIKPSVIILGEREGTDEVRYIHSNYGRGTFTFYGGHDPEDYQHAVGDPPTDLNLHKNSPGYRIILNNILFPAAKKKQQKT